MYIYINVPSGGAFDARAIIIPTMRHNVGPTFLTAFHFLGDALQPTAVS
jgi:hypothetical protein